MDFNYQTDAILFYQQDIKRLEEEIKRLKEQLTCPNCGQHYKIHKCNCRSEAIGP